MSGSTNDEWALLATLGERQKGPSVGAISGQEEDVIA
jgi:hypothetical protein